MHSETEILGSIIKTARQRSKITMEMPAEKIRKLAINLHLILSPKIPREKISPVYFTTAMIDPSKSSKHIWKAMVICISSV